MLMHFSVNRSCAKKLRAGEVVLPEAYGGATVYFSDIVGFLDIAAISTPMQVVDLLNDMSICFDNIVCQYDAYKVSWAYQALVVIYQVAQCEKLGEQENKQNDDRIMTKKCVY